MKKQYFIRITLIALLSAMLLLLAAVLATTAFEGRSNVYAAESTPTEATEAPLAYTYTAGGGENAEAYYTVTGIDPDKMAELNLSLDQKKNLKITIPAEYDDGTPNGRAPVKAIADNAFSESDPFSNNSNTDLNFVDVDLSQAGNLETIGKASFYSVTSEQQLTLPQNVKKILEYAFSKSNFSGIVFNDALEYVDTNSFANMQKMSDTVNITSKMQFTNSDGAVSDSNVFYNSSIKAFTVAKGSEHYKAIDGVLYSNDGETLIAYPGGKEKVDVFRVPPEVKTLAYRSFQNIKNITTTIVLPNTVETVRSYALYDIAADVYLNDDSRLRKGWSNTNFTAPINSSNVIYVIFDTEEDKTTFLQNNRFQEDKISDQLLVLESISAVFNSEAEGTIPTTATAEELKQHFTASGNAANSITVPIDNFTITLPRGGLVKGNNEVTVKYSDFSTTVDINAEGTTPPAPETPVVSGTPTTNSITLTAIEGAEYSCNGGDWQDSPIFTGLTPNTEYTFLARIKETTTTYVSPESAPATIKTDKVTPAAPAAPVVSGTPTANSITLTAIAGAEYSCDDGVTWQDSPIFTGLTPNTEYTFLARIKATDSAHASPASVVLTIKTAEIPAKGGLSGGAIAGIVIGSILIAGILALLALFFFRKDKSQGFKEYYVALGGTCATTAKGWGGKIKQLFQKEKAEKPTDTLPEESGADQAPAAEPDDNDAEPKN